MEAIKKNILLIILLVILIPSFAGNIWTFFEMSGIEGSPKITFSILILVITLLIIVFLSNEEKRNHVLALLQGGRSSQDYNIRVKKELYPEIEKKILNAKKEIVILGGLSSSLMNIEFFNDVAKLLSTNQQVTLKFLTPSDENVTARLEYLQNAKDIKDFRTWENKKDKVEDWKSFDSLVLDYVLPELKLNVKKRLITKTISKILYANIIRVDGTIYYSPLTNRRNSRGLTFILADENDSMYQAALEYLDFLTPTA